MFKGPLEAFGLLFQFCSSVVLIYVCLFWVIETGHSKDRFLVGRRWGGGCTEQRFVLLFAARVWDQSLPLAGDLVEC